MSTLPIYLSSFGMACPIGLTAASACAAIRARINRFRESRYRDNEGEPVVCSEVTRLPADMSSSERSMALLELAVTDAARDLDTKTLPPLPLLLSTAEPERPGGTSEVLQKALSRLHEKCGLNLDPAHSRAFPMGNTGGLHALAEARALLKRNPQLPGCFVSGVDSFVNGPSLWWLDQQLRLKRPAQGDGVIPGEAAACVLVTRKPRGRTPSVVVLGLGFAQERATLATDEPLRAKGLAQASRAALAEAGFGMEDIDFRLSDASGESYFFKELALTLSQVLRVRKESMPLWLPAETLGELGAASAVAELVIAGIAMQRGYAPGPRAIGYASSLSGARAAVVLCTHTELGGTRRSKNDRHQGSLRN